MEYIKMPNKIEKSSFEIISDELDELNIKLNDKEASIIKRVIHTTADFEYAKILKFSDNAIENGIDILKKNETIYCDTQMIKNGLREDRLGCKLVNFVHDKDVKKEAKKRNITRSMAGIEKACKKGIKVFVIGNAPTCLFKIKELIEKNKLDPKLIIAVPVGFVGAVESKDAIMDLDIPYIATKGRKGGSPVAVAIINALYKKGLNE
ncbi:MAG: precorrin-8X methylmutase [Bacillota bacterium]